MPQNMSEREGAPHSEPDGIGIDAWVKGIEFCRRHSYSPVIISLPVDIDSTAIAARFVEQHAAQNPSEDYLVVDAQALANGPDYYPSIDEYRNKKGIVVVGYGPEFAAEALATIGRFGDAAQNHTRENNIQNFVRNAVGGNHSSHDIVLLSQGRPTARVFKSDFWWYNGPFPDGAIWELREEEGTIARINLEQTVEMPGFKPVWKEKRV